MAAFLRKYGELRSPLNLLVLVLKRGYGIDA